MEYAPYKLFTSAERDVRVYTEWMSSDGAWELQVSIESIILIILAN